MKKLLPIIFVALCASRLLATTNMLGMPTEITLGGGGFTVPHTGETQFGLNGSLSVQPFKKPVWLSISQEITWEPNFAGATDLGADWAWNIWKERLYLNTGWSGGAIYDSRQFGLRTGPEASLEYYTSGNAFIIGSMNYDLITKESAQRGFVLGTGQSIFRYSIGIGIAF